MRRLAVLLGAAGLACTDVGSDPQQPVAIEFDSLPAPAIVYGDTLRDLLGVVAPLSARVFNVDGDLIVGAPIDFFSSDPAAVRIDAASDFAIALEDTARKTVTIRAQAGGIPAATTRALDLVPRPDSLARAVGVPSDRIDTVRYQPADTAVTGPPMVVRVLHRDTTATDSVRGVKSWRVRYAVIVPAGADTLLVDDATRRSVVDTTAADGVASRRLFVRRLAGGTFPDSIAVDASAWYRDGLLAGAPIRFILRVLPAP